MCAIELVFLLFPCCLWYIVIFLHFGYFVGPLLYHFSDMPNESSIELSYSEVKDVIRKYNFEIVVNIQLFIVASVKLINLTYAHYLPFLKIKD